ncbi:MAG TPA: flagellar export protein FliJ [Pseudobdellovibrionaceae bacterium]|nr:flagellar export protein FliJ [Pseudobdellovibrionaceae bacterium]
MAFQFPLQRVLDHRKTKENIAQKEYQEARHLLALETEKLEQMQKDLSNSYEFVSGSHQSSFSPQASQQAVEFQNGQRRLIVKQEEKVRDLEVIVESRRVVLLSLTIDHKVIEKLKERKHEEYEFEVRKAEAAETDEANILRHRFRREASSLVENDELD